MPKSKKFRLKIYSDMSSDKNRSKSAEITNQEFDAKFIIKVINYCISYGKFNFYTRLLIAKNLQTLRINTFKSAEIRNCIGVTVN